MWPMKKMDKLQASAKVKTSHHNYHGLAHRKAQKASQSMYMIQMRPPDQAGGTGMLLISQLLRTLFLRMRVSMPTYLVRRLKSAMTMVPLGLAVLVPRLVKSIVTFLRCMRWVQNTWSCLKIPAMRLSVSWFVQICSTVQVSQPFIIGNINE